MSASSRHLTALRLAAQTIEAAPAHGSVADVVRHMVAMQAQDLPGARWAIGLRLPGSTDDAVTAALTDGSIVRSWPQRGTLHVVAPEDLGWMLGLTAPRQATFAAKRRRDLEIADHELASAGDIAVSLLVGGRSIRRDALLEAWEAAGIPTTGQRGYQLLWNLAQHLLIVFGPPDGKQPTFVLYEEWVTAPRSLEREEALGEWARRYFSSHGPATERDFAWWSSLTLGDARKAIALAEGLQHLDVDGVGYWMREGLEPGASGVHLLPGFDEYLLGYQDRSPALAAEFAQRIVPGNNGMFLPTVVVDGQVVGTWKRSDTVKLSRVDLSPFTTMTKKTYALVDQALARYSAFLGRPVERTGG